jgi:hypothetical protein
MVNFASALACKRCHESLTMPASYETTEPAVSTSASTSNEDHLFNEFRARRDGNLIVITEDSVLPERCVRCNAPSTRQINRRVFWTPSYVNIVILFSWIIGLSFFLNRTQSAAIRFGLCDSHYVRRLIGLIVGGGMCAAGLLMGVIVVFNSDYTLLCVGGGSLIVGAFVVALLARTLDAAKIDEPYIWLKGASQAFLQSLSA